MVLEVAHQMTRQLHEVVLNHPHDMEAVRHDAGLGKVTADQAAIGAGEIDADDLHPLPAFEFAEECRQVRFAFSRPELEDPTVLQVAEGGAEALALVEGVFVDAKVARTVQREAFGGLADGELLVDAGDGRLAEGLPEGKGFGADAVMMQSVDLLPERFGAVASGQDAGEPGNEAFVAGKTMEPAGVDDEACRRPEAIEVADLALVAALAQEPSPAATGAAFERGSGLGLDMDGGRARLVALKGVVTLQAYI